MTLVILYLLALMLVGLVFHLVAPLIYDYQICDKHFEIRLLRAVPLMRIPISEIAGVEVLNWSQAILDGRLIGALRLGNRFARHVVLITKKNGTIKHLLLTPARASGFARELMAGQGKEDRFSIGH
jgi:hypothetical protein